MMITSKGGVAPATASQPSPVDQQQDCCMCGDFGLSSELFRCKICQFRSQHRYCSNIYPKAESYRVCNWCLDEKEEKAQNSNNSSSSNKTGTNEDDVIKIKKKSIQGNGNNHLQRSNSSIKNEREPLKLNSNNHSIKKQKSPESAPLLAARKRITTSSAVQESLRRTKSEEMSNSGMKKHFVKNRVRRYKLLDEVSS